MGSATRDGEQKISLTHAEVLVMPRSLFQTVGGIDPAKKNNLVSPAAIPNPRCFV
jgi:hypothetical protein